MGKIGKRNGNYLYGAFGRDFETKDKERLMIVGLTPKQWSSIVTATEREEEIAALEASMGLDLEKKAIDLRRKRPLQRPLNPGSDQKFMQRPVLF